MTRAMQHLVGWRRAREQVAEPHAHHVDRNLAILGAGVLGWVTLAVMTLQGLKYLNAILE